MIENSAAAGRLYRMGIIGGATVLVFVSMTNTTESMQVNVRMPVELVEAAKQAAAEDERSVAWLIRHALAAYLGWGNVA